MTATLTAPPVRTAPAVPAVPAAPAVRDAPTSPAAGRRISWDVLRVLAITSVVVQHATFTLPGVIPWISRPPFTWSVEAGANTLMVISAFFVCTTLTKGRPGRWWVRRLARLLPAYAVAVVVTYLLTLVASRYGYWHPGVRDLVGNLLLVQTWDPQVTFMDGSYWTLPLQLTIFTLAALAVAHAGRDVWRRSWSLPLVAWAAIVAPLATRWIGDAGVVRVADGLVLYRWQLFGIGLAVWLRSRGRMGWWHLAAVLAAGLAVEYVYTPDLPSLLVLAGACVAVVAAAVGPDWTWLRWGPVGRVIGWLAGISYGVYLLNQQIGYFLAWFLQARFGVEGWPRLLVVLAVAVLLGWLITVLVERPAYRRLTVRSSAPLDLAAASDAPSLALEASDSAFSTAGSHRPDGERALSGGTTPPPSGRGRSAPANRW